MGSPDTSALAGDVRRPWRFAPSGIDAGFLRRPRLLTAMHQRWTLPLTTVTAGAGFGKSTLLAQAIAENEIDPAGADVHIRLLPSDASAAALARTIGYALGVESTDDSDVAAEPTARIHNALWAHAPTHVAIVLDDVHVVLGDASAQDLLAALVQDLPRNAHVVLSSRTEPFSEDHLRGVDVLRLHESDLAFDPSELEELGVDGEHTGGWPVAVGMAAAGRGKDIGTLLESTMLDMDDGVREALVATALLGGADAQLLADIGIDPGAAGSLADTPLVSTTRGRWLTVHEVWTRTVEALTAPDRRIEILRSGAAALRSRGLREEAFTAAAACGNWDLALDVARDLGASYVTELDDPRQLDRWLGMLPSPTRKEPGALLLEALSWRLRDPWDPLGVSSGRAACAGFRARGDQEAEVAGLHQTAYLCFVQGDQDVLAEIVGRVAELDALGVDAAAPYAALGRAVVNDALGDDAGVLDELSTIDTETLSRDWVGVVEWLRTNALLMLGRHDEARRHGELAGSTATKGFGGFVGARAIARWFDGAVEQVLDEELPEVRTPRDRFFLGTNGAMGRAAAGRTDEARRVFAVARTEKDHLDSPAEAAAVALTEASIALGELAEPLAARVLDDYLARFPLEEGPVERALRNRLALVYVLCPTTRDLWDRAPLGPGWQVGLSLARALVRVRDSGPQTLGDVAWPPPAIAFAHLSLLHACELAAAGKAAGRPEATTLIRWLTDTIGPRVREVLRHLEQTAIPSVAEGAHALSASVPVRPSYRLEVCVLGPMSVRRGGEPNDASELRRERVRALLALLVARRREHRERLASVLWPDFPVKRGAANLRTTLNYLLVGLEPRRRSGEPAFHLRSEGAYLELFPSDLLSVDLWEFRRHIADARRAEQAGLTTEVLDRLLAACDLWRGDAFAEFGYEDWAMGVASRTRADFVWGATRAAELLVAAGDTGRAVDLAARAVALEPLHEPCHRALALAYLDRNERAAAWRVMESCQQELADAGLTPEPVTIELVERLRSGQR